MEPSWERSRLDAEAWRVRLDVLSISVERLKAFALWRANPRNARAWDVLLMQERARAERIT